MNWLANQKSILLNFFLFSFLCTLFSCNNPSDIRLDIEPDTEVLFTELPVEASILLADSIQTSATVTGRLIAGKYEDPTFGATEAEAYSMLTMTQENIVLNNVDSIVLTLKYISRYGKAFHKQQNFQVYRLDEELDSSKIYSSVKTLYSKLIGEVAVEITPPSDTSFIRIPLDVTTFDNVSFTSQIDFNEQFYGIAIVGGVDASAVITIDVSDSFLNIYYDGNGEENPSELFQLTFTPFANNGYSYINADRSNTDLNNITEYTTPYEPVNNLVYAQAGVGLVTKINLQSFHDFLDTADKNIVINKADLVFEDIEPFLNDEIDVLPPPSSIVYYYTDENNKRLIDELGFFKGVQNIGFSPLNSGNILLVSFNEETKSYEGRVSLYLEALQRKDLDYDNLLIYPLNVGSSLNRFSVKTDNIKLKVFYTQLID